MAGSRREYLDAALEHRPVDAVPQAGAGVDESALLARGHPGRELGTRADRRLAPLHAGVLRAELGDLHNRAAPVALDRPEACLPLIRPAGQVRPGGPARQMLPVGSARPVLLAGLARPVLPVRHGPRAPARRPARFSATSASHSATARVV